MENNDSTPPDSHASLIARSGELLYGVYDPEVGLDIMTMGLVFEIKYDESENTIVIVMTLTSRGCPMGPMIMQNVTEVLEAEFPGKKVEIQLVWEPPWSIDMISEDGRIALGWR